MHEIEVKILSVDPAAIAAQLEELGAVQVLDTTLIVDWFAPVSEDHSTDPWYLRVRTDSSGKSEVTWKGKSEVLGVARKHKEVNVTVSDPISAAELFTSIGMPAYAHQEKRRTSWTLGTVRFDLDTYPGLPPYLEIEAGSEEEIQIAIAQLGLGSHETCSDGERKLIEGKYGLNWYQMKF